MRRLWPHVLRDPAARHTLVRFALLLAAIALVALAAAAAMRSVSRERACEFNLRRIYTALEQYEDEFGVLPVLAYYPTDVRLDPESLYIVLRPYGLALSDCICPATPEVLQRTGITYVWNTVVNGRSLRSLDPPQWILVEMNALSGKVPPPHRGRYHVLYSDGSIRSERRRP